MRRRPARDGICFLEVDGVNAMTAANLKSAYGGESMAHMRYLLWADKADQDSFPDVGRLFRAISYAEQVHAGNHFRELAAERGDSLVPAMAPFGYTTTSENLEGAIAGEEFEVDQMYPVYLEAAKFQKERGAQLSFHYALSAEKTHAAMFRRAKEAVDAGGDLPLGAVQVCDVCGWTYEGEIPDECPICRAKRDKFTTFS